MNRKLSEQDRKAVDLLLETSTHGGGSNAAAPRGTFTAGGSVITQANLTLKPNVGAVERVFALLDLLPAEEPSADLMARTFERISEAAGSEFTGDFMNAGIDPVNQPRLNRIPLA